MENGSDVNLVNNLVESQVPSAQIERYTSSEAYYLLPRNESNNFPNLFKALEDNIQSIHQRFVRSYGISMTSLEEVFLKLGEEAEQEENNHSYNTFNNSLNHTPDWQLKFKPSFLQSFFAFLKIRFLIFARNPGHIFPIVLAPVIIIIVSYFLMRNNKASEAKPNPLLLKPSIYDNKTKILPYFSSGTCIMKTIIL